MNGDESFDRELKDMLNDLAADRVPDDLVLRVAAIPELEPSRRTNMSRLGTAFAMGFAALAGVGVALVLVAVVLSPRTAGPGPIVGGSPTPAPSNPAPSATASSSSPTATPAPSAPAAVAVPQGFQAASVTFVSPERGFVLGSGPCSSGTCAIVAQTGDAGRTWSLLSDLPTTLTAPTGQQTQSGVATLRFATPNDGWAFGPQELWSTHDGGATWTRTALPGLATGATVQAVETSAGLVNAVVLDCGSSGCSFAVETSPIGQDSWSASNVRLPVGAGPVPQVQLVLNGSAGWIVQNDRTVVNGARLVGGAWETWQPPCASVQGPAYLAASSASDLVAICDVGEWSTPKGEHLFTSHDGGTTFTETGSNVPISQVRGIASGSSQTIVVAGFKPAAGGVSSALPSTLAESFNGGQTWTVQTFSLAGLFFSDLGFTTADQGVAILSSGTLLMTRDGGHSWNEVKFRS